MIISDLAKLARHYDPARRTDLMVSTRRNRKVSTDMDAMLRNFTGKYGPIAPAQAYFDNITYGSTSATATNSVANTWAYQAALQQQMSSQLLSQYGQT